MSSEALIARDYLTSLLNKRLRVHIEDGRMFVGQLKCTDNERNLIMGITHEYRLSINPAELNPAGDAGGSTTTKPELMERFVGLVVIPGQYITKIEIQDW